MSTLINSTSLGNFIIVTGSFILLIVLIKVFAWEQLTGIFDEREKKIAADIDGAENARQEAETLAQKRQEELNGARTEASSIVESAKETGKQQEAQIVAEAHETASRLREKTEADIAQSKAEALADVKEEVAELTVLLAEKILAKELDKTAQSNLIDNYLDQLGDA
ncbi:F0F1 ATP synthase subunit B [Streptococcus hyovaginalis]|uniref:F0F1 ATP synthase subunit B n=1 Tax=Streptococcus hyovaginalis TaxID=149015 RepID=UPI00041B515C|nr:F0F1 ATP synthase subunit B [Streptococcus hyovaginalis]MDY4510080.1 F0F1 ATP synthase subunit B [Streptococcus hyovaginalis]MDY5973983.1 F0F1 ATP synthase subunit B [Streptococcus hyovaginalis]